MRLLLLLAIIVSVIAIAPPHPDAEDEVHEMHRSLKGAHDSTGKTSLLVNAALCSGMTEKECLHMNEEFHRQARKLKKIYQTTGYLKVLVICVRFSDHADRGLPTQEQYDVFFNSPAPDADLAPTGSVKQFIEHNSQGALEVDFDIMPWKTTNNTEAYYSFNKSGITRDFGASTHSVMDQLEADGVDFSNYDLNNDGKIDAIMLLHSGYQAEVGNIDCYTGALPKQRIWSHAIPAPSNAWVSSISGMALDNYSVGGGLRGVCWNRIPRLGIITHEFLHLFGLPDLYDKNKYIGHGLGHYSLMASRE